MVRLLSLLVIVGFVCGVATWTMAQSDSGGLANRPLDLPSGGIGDDDEEEDEAESITFYGSEYEGDGFFWCLDKSGSMSWGGRMNVLMEEMCHAIPSLSSRSDFSIVAFSTNTVTWSQFAQPANSANKTSAMGWVQTLPAAGWTCLLDAGVKTVEIANNCSKRNKQIIVLSDGVPVCYGNDTSQQCLTEITGANWQRIPINTFYISTDSQGAAFMQALAQSNGGIFTLSQ